MVRELKVGDRVAVNNRERGHYGWNGIITEHECNIGFWDEYQYFRVHFDRFNEGVYEASELRLLNVGKEGDDGAE